MIEHVTETSIPFGDNAVNRISVEYIQEADNYKEDRVKLFNCGVPGDSSSKAVDRLYEDCLIFNPDIVVIMFGANDIGRVLYMPNKEIENVEEADVPVEEEIQEKEKSNRWKFLKVVWGKAQDFGANINRLIDGITVDDDEETED